MEFDDESLVVLAIRSLISLELRLHAVHAAMVLYTRCRRTTLRESLLVLLAHLVICCVILYCWSLYRVICASACLYVRDLGIGRLRSNRIFESNIFNSNEY